jgi:hypothetical protein
LRKECDRVMQAVEARVGADNPPGRAARGG